MLYTVVPLEQIYKNDNRNRKDLVEGMENIEYKRFQIAHGHIIARREGDQYVVHQIHSTNMEDYLNEQYYPGKNYRPEC